MEENQNYGLCTASMVLGIVGIFCNPCWIPIILAVIFGILGMTRKPEPANKSQALIGLICAGVGAFIQVIADIFTLGMGIFF